MLLILFTVSSCGKTIKESGADPKKPVREEAVPDDQIIPGDFIRAQKIVCEDGILCPESIAKIIVLHDGNTNECIGTLIEEDKIMTSATCLPKSLRIPYLGCSKNVFALFAESKWNPSEIVGCKDIEYVNNNLYSEPALWQSDFAIIRLNKKVSREFASLSKEGVEDNQVLSAWAIEKQLNNLGLIKEVKCTSNLSTYLNPLSDSSSSSLFVVNGCDLELEDTGAPFYRGNKVMGIFSIEMSDSIYNYLKGSKIVDGDISRYFHVNNVSCSEFSESYIGPIAPGDCFKLKTISMLDQKRSEMLKNVEVHKDGIAKVKAALEVPNKYFLWNAKFQFDARLRSIEPHFGKPKCIYDSKSWIGDYRNWRRYIRTYARIEVETPNYILQTKLSRDLKPVSVVTDEGIKTYTIEFNPYAAHVEKDTFVTISSVLHGVETSVTYDSVKANCD